MERARHRAQSRADRRGAGLRAAGRAGLWPRPRGISPASAAALWRAIACDHARRQGMAGGELADACGRAGGEHRSGGAVRHRGRTRTRVADCRGDTACAGAGPRAARCDGAAHCRRRVRGWGRHRSAASRRGARRAVDRNFFGKRTWPDRSDGRRRDPCARRQRLAAVGRTRWPEAIRRLSETSAKSLPLNSSRRISISSHWSSALASFVCTSPSAFSA